MSSYPSSPSAAPSARYPSSVSALISACHHIGARVLAEGVESHEQLDSLLDVKCDAVQGYIFGKPMPEDAFEDLLRAEPAVPEDWIR